MILSVNSLKLNPVTPTQQPKVVKMFFNHTVPRFKVPLSISSNKKTCFVATVIRDMNRVLRLTWDLKTPYRPQASSKIKYVNRTFKTQIN